MRPLLVGCSQLIVENLQERGSEYNDDLILDCCQYFASYPHGGVVRHVALCSGDKNLCVKVESVGGGFLYL
jgi:hypothetical protein